MPKGGHMEFSLPVTRRTVVCFVGYICSIQSVSPCVPDSFPLLKLVSRSSG
ncbi:hypothetical protein HanXRQr2_Chr17g0793541 [Helianthus annuus]|uniref:Uncharacterized protein n=1 Tax=Helianthus annuus TaxID=4232 RepID=A0A9K3DH84_HELAN|nr:hypothetical protein HanXRQr2_Chr17g0793541 [Helianthus annuus]KAJ0812394.1 hypothetical protein HanPSC8_Chr17g0761541 [Helianthus annuus]